MGQQVEQCLANHFVVPTPPRLLSANLLHDALPAGLKWGVSAHVRDLAFVIQRVGSTFHCLLNSGDDALERIAWNLVAQNQVAVLSE